MQQINTQTEDDTLEILKIKNRSLEAALQLEKTTTQQMIRKIQVLTSKVKELEHLERKVIEMANVFIGIGHGGNDPGAVANGLVERDVNLIMALACRDELKRHGVHVVLSRTTNTESDTIYEEVREENSASYDIAFEIHNNAGRGDGSEFFYFSGDPKGKKLATLCKKHTEAIGQNCRKVVAKDDFIWINSTKATAVLCEGFFLDNTTDKQIADTIEEQRRFGVAYAKAILEFLGIPYKEIKPQPEQKPTGKKLYRVQIGAFKVKKNAEALVKEMKVKGYNAIIKEE